MKFFTPHTPLNKYRKSFYTAAILLIGFASATAQVSTYTFSQSEGTYMPIEGSTVFGTDWDDNTTNKDLGFTFNYDGVNYSYIRINSNGYLTFGNTVFSEEVYSPISANNYTAAVSVFGSDLKNNGEYIRYETSGSAPNRVFTVQWDNARRANSSVAGDVLNFQIKLYETSNAVEVVYGNCSTTSTFNGHYPQVGLRGVTYDYNARTGISGWSSTVNSTSAGSTVKFDNTHVPSDGLTFLWNRPDCYRPIAISAPLITDSEITFAWNSPFNASDMGYDYIVKDGISAGSLLIASGTTAPGITNVTVSGLAQGTLYTFWVRSACSESEVSPLNGNYNFTTQYVTPVPWSDIQSNPQSNVPFPTGWNITGWTTGSAGPGIGGSGNTIRKRFYSAAPSASFQTITVGPLETNDRFRFDYKTINYADPYAPTPAGSGSFNIDISSDFGVTWTTFQTVVNVSNAGWNHELFSLSSFAGQKVKMRIVATRNSGDFNFAFDRFQIEAVPSCEIPETGFAASNITLTSAILSWTPALYEPSAYEYYLTESSSESPNTTNPTPLGTTSSASAGLTGLNSNKTYYWWVRSVCSESNKSVWVEGGTFSTLNAEPSNQATDFTATSGETSLSLSWTYAAGPFAADGYLLKAKKTNDIENPVDGISPSNKDLSYTEARRKVDDNDYTFGSGTPGTMYYIKNFAYANSDDNIDFKIEDAPSLNYATKPPSEFFPSVAVTSATTATVFWNLANTAYDSSKYETLVFIRQGMPVSLPPANFALENLASYMPNTVFGSGTAFENDAAAYNIYKGDGTSVDVTGLLPGYIYYVAVTIIMHDSNYNGTHSMSVLKTASGSTTLTPGQIGTGTNYSTNLPIFWGETYNYSQIIYTATELEQALSPGNNYITAIRFKPHVVPNNPENSKNWTVYMANTEKSFFADYTQNYSGWLPSQALTQVYSNDIPALVADQWVEIELATPFLWDGTSNILIAIDENSPDDSFAPGDGDNWYCYTASEKRGLPFYSNVNIDVTLPQEEIGGANSPSPTFKIPQVQIVSTVPAYEEPTNVQTVALSDASGSASWAQPGGELTPESYVWELRLSGTGGSGSSGLIQNGETETATTITFESLLSSTTYYFYIRSKYSGGNYSPWLTGNSFTTEAADTDIFTSYIGSDSELVTLPLDITADYNYSQQIYRAAELAQQLDPASNYITDIGFKSLFTPLLPGNCSHWTVYMANTTQNSFQNTSFFPMEGLTPVFSGDVYAWTESAWVDVHLDTPFLWNGTDNLIIALYEDSPGHSDYYQGDSYDFSGFVTDQPRGIQNVDSENFDISDNSEFDNIYVSPKIPYLGLIAVDPAFEEPAEVAAEALGDTSGFATWEVPGEVPPVSYQYELRTSGTGGSGSSGLLESGETETAGTVTFNSLTPETTYYFYIRCEYEATNYSPWLTGASFVTESLSIENPKGGNEIIAFKNNDILTIQSGNSLMSAINVFDMRGALIYSKTGVNADVFAANDFHPTLQPLIVQVITTDDKKLSIKVIY